jgi:hypothetical protein
MKNKEKKTLNRTYGFKMMITNNKENIRRKSCLPQID